MTINHTKMPNEPPHQRGPEPGVPHVSDEAVRRLAEAVARLANDPDFFLEGLTEFLLAMEPVASDRLSANEARFLIESGDFTADELTATSAGVARGALQVSATETWLLELLATKSLEEVAGFLGWTEEDVRSAVAEERLYAVEVSGRLRFPTWQLDARSPTKLLPRIAEVIKVMAPRWGHQSVAGFMATPQESLVAEGRKTPVQWLRDGGHVDDVTEIIEASDWS
jgi:hypothetical protein